MKKINLRESLLKIDRSTDFKHALTDLYEACMLEDGDKKKLAQFIEDRDIPGMSAMLSNKAGIMSENVSDDLPDEEMPDDIDACMEGLWNPNMNDCPACGDLSFDTKAGKCTKCSYREGVDNHLQNGDELDEGIFSIAGDAVGRGLGDLYKGVKNVAKGVRDVAVAGASDAKKAVTDIKQSKFADKVRDASRAIKNADTVDDFKSDYKRRQEMRQKSDTKRDQVWKDRRGNERIGKSIGNEQDWIYVVNGKKMNYDEYKKIPSAERSKLNNEGKVQKLDLSGKPITKSQNKKRLNAKVKESLLLEGPGAGYEIACNITIDNFLGATTIKRIEVDRDPGAFPGSYKVYLSCEATGSADDIEANSYYYGDTFGGSYPVKISEILMSVSVVGEGDIRDAVEESLDDILSDLVGFTFTSKYVYGGGWSHSTYDGTLTDTTNPLNDTCWGEDDNISYEVYGMDVRLTDSDIIEEIDMAVTGENEDDDFEESLNESDSIIKESYTHFTYKSGANPYIAKTDAEVNKLLKKYGNKVKEIKPGFYEVDDTLDSSDTFKFDSLTESARGRFNLEVWVPGSGGDDDRERPLISSNNMQEIIDTAYATELDSDEAFYLSDMRGIYPYDLDQCYDAEELEDAIYNEWHYTPAGDMRKTLGKMLLPQNEGVESSKEWEHKDKDGKIGRIRQSDGRGDRKFLTRDQASEIAKFRGHEDDELYPVNESESIKEASYGFKNGNRYYGGLPNDEDIFDSPQVYYPKEETKIADNNDPVAVRKLRQNIANPLYKLILDEVAPENQVDGDQLYVTAAPNSEEIYLVSEVLLDNDCPNKSTAMSNIKNYLNRKGISFNPQLIEVDIDSFDDGETYVYTAFPLSALSMKSNEALNKDLDKSKSINEDICDADSWEAHQDKMARKTSGYDKCYKEVCKALESNDYNALSDIRDHFGYDLYKMCLGDARKKFGESFKMPVNEAFKPADSGVQSVKVYNQYNYTIQELRIDNDNHTFERGNFTMGKPDKKFKNRQQYEDVVDQLKELGYTEVSSGYQSLRNKSRKGVATEGADNSTNIARPLKESNFDGYEIKNVNGHYEAYKNSKFICSGDTESEVKNELKNIESPESGMTKYKVTWKVINIDDSYFEESKEVLAKDEKSAKATVKDKRAREIKAVKMTEAFKHPQFDGPWWYLCKHGIGPGALPKDVTVLETVEDETNPYRVYVALDKVLTTSELRQYEMKEARPPQKMTESNRFRNHEGKVDASKWYASKYPTDKVGIEQLSGLYIDDLLKDRSPLGRCDTQVRDRVYAQLDNYSKIELSESTTNSSKLIRNAITELVRSGSSISDPDFVDDVMDYMEDAFGEHPSYREVLNTVRDFRSKERTNTLRSVDTSSRNTFQVGDEMTYSGLYGGETTIKVLGVNGSRMKAEISWPSMEDGSDLKDKKVFDIVLDDEGNDCIEVWHYRGETGRVYPPKRGSGLEESFSTGDRVKQKFANPYNVGKIIGKKKTPKDGEMVRVKWDYSDGDDVEWVSVDDVSPYNEDDEKAGYYESLFRLRDT